MPRLKGFTLVEVLIVIAIIGVLSTLTVIAVRSARQKAKIAKAQHDIDIIYTAMGQLMVDTGEWPGHQTAEEINSGSANELWDLATDAAGILSSDGLYLNWAGPYMGDIPIDPWGNKYFFDTDYQLTTDNKPCNGNAGCHNSAVVGSFGPDGIGQNLYNADDIIKIIK